MKLSTLFSIHDSLTWTSDNYDNDLTSAFWDSSLTTPFQCASPKFATIWLELQAITIVISCLHSGTLVWLLPSNVPLPPNLPSSQSAWRSTWQNQMKLSILFSALKKMKAVIENHVHEVLEEWTKSRSFPHTKNQSVSWSKDRAQFTDLSIVKRQGFLRAVALKFTSCIKVTLNAAWMHNEMSVAQLKASYTYIYNSQKDKLRFLFNVAYRELCTTKAQAVSNGTSVILSVYLCLCMCVMSWFLIKSNNTLDGSEL